MSDHAMECRVALAQVFAFLDHELAEGDADEIRVHLHGCDDCLDEFDVQQALKALVRRGCGQARAPESLRLRVVAQVHSVEITTLTWVEGESR